MMNRVVVMGGSFNPPTLAHLKLMRAALDAVDACQGVYVPTAHEYVEKKMKRQRCPQDTLSESVRLDMLESFRKYDSRISVSRIQMLKTERGYDYEMLEEIQTDFPDTEIYFVTGSDKLYVLPRWHRVDELIARFRILVAKRGEDDLEKIKEIRPYLAEHWDRFTVFDAPEEISAISSSAFREKLHSSDESAKELVTQEVWEIMSKNGKLPWNSITDFHEEQYRFLSNFYEAHVLYGGLVYGSNEAAFQAQKCVTEEEKVQFTEFGPGKSKGVGRRVQLRPDWEDVKTGIMEEIVRAKFTQHQELAARLLATGDKVLVEGNHWGDTCWGVDTRTGQGENRLGKILMKVREELKKAYEA
ncbi:MAG: DUF1768 domain-containing protein [Clostridia bacterium]|nr:DUF1768 domain-containing protein [Clostridia bacterium]